MASNFDKLLKLLGGLLRLEVRSMYQNDVGHQEDKPSCFDIRRVRNSSWEDSIAAIDVLFS